MGYWPASATKSALADYYLAEKGNQVAQENLKILREFRQNAESRYKTGVGSQQDVLQADVELARLEERLVALRRARLVAIARINTLMHTSPDAPLPPSAEIRSEAALPDAVNLRSLAIQSRPARGGFLLEKPCQGSDSTRQSRRFP